MLRGLVWLPNEDFGCNPTNSPHKMFLHTCVLQYVRHDGIIGEIEMFKMASKMAQKDKILNIFLSIWARHIVFVATSRFLRSRNRLSTIKFMSDISVSYNKWRAKWAPKHEILDTFLNIRTRIIILVSICGFWGSRNTIGMLKLTDFDVFSLLKFRKRTDRSHGIKKTGNCKRKSRVQKLANCTLRDLATTLDVHGRHCMH